MEYQVLVEIDMKKSYNSFGKRSDPLQTHSTGLLTFLVFGYKTLRVNKIGRKWIGRRKNSSYILEKQREEQ